MDVREKLVEILLQEDDLCERGECKDCFANGSCYYYRVADSLISNGVTVQEWVSVKDRLPDDEQEVLVIAQGWGGRLVYVGSHKRVEAQKSWLTGITNKSSEWLLYGWSYLKEPMVTHWMPIPQPPKGE